MLYWKCVRSVTKNQKCDSVHAHSLIGGWMAAWVCGKWKTATSFFCHKIYHANSSHLIFYFISVFLCRFFNPFSEIRDIFGEEASTLCVFVCAPLRDMLCTTKEKKKKKNKRHTAHKTTEIECKKSSSCLFECKEASLTFHHLEHTERERKKNWGTEVEFNWEEKKTHAQRTQDTFIFFLRVFCTFVPIQSHPGFQSHTFWYGEKCAQTIKKITRLLLWQRRRRETSEKNRKKVKRKTRVNLQIFMIHNVQ